MGLVLFTQHGHSDGTTFETMAYKPSTSGTVRSTKIMLFFGQLVPEWAFTTRTRHSMSAWKLSILLALVLHLH